MDIRQVLNILNVKPEMQTKAIKAWDMAKEMSQGVVTKEDAINLLRAKGIDNEKLQKIGGYINHPTANVVAKVAGVDISKIRKNFNDLLSNNVENPKVENNDISKYRESLKHL